MSKFNNYVAPVTARATTTNRSGHAAYSMTDKEALVSAVMTTMIAEPKFYGSTDSDIVRLASACAVADPEFLAKLACYTRNVANLRSVSHVLTAIVAHDANKYTRDVIRNVVVRPDDITEIMACYTKMFGKPFPNAMKREIASDIQKFSEYQIAKYNGGNKDITFRDVLRITHPVPKASSNQEIFNKIINDTLETPYTWETELSAKGNTREVWNELIASKKLGYMAMLRNLRNMVKVGANIKPVLKILADPNEVKKSRQLPFRFYSAYKMLEREGLLTKEIAAALESAISSSVDNMETIKGRTLIAVDVSGSMSSRVSEKSEVSCKDIASLFAAMTARICEDATVCYFSSSGSSWYGYNRNNDIRSGYKIERYGKYEDILEICNRNHSVGTGGTDMYLPMEYALKVDENRRPFDRVIYFSDNECNSRWSGGLCGETVENLVDEYRRKYNRNFWVHGVDLQGYGTQQFTGKRFNLIAGWNDSVLPFINLAESGFSNLVTEISNYDISK